VGDRGEKTHHVKNKRKQNIQRTIQMSLILSEYTVHKDEFLSATPKKPDNGKQKHDHAHLYIQRPKVVFALN
jgi:hypothetical protein